MAKPLPPAGTRVAVYWRYSTGNQTYQSIERQKDSTGRFAAEKSWIIVESFEDAERSGTTFVGREGFFEMMAAANRGEFSVVLVEDLSRLSRKAGDTHMLYEELAELDIGICTVAKGRMIEDVDVMVDAYKNAKDVEEASFRARGGVVRVIESGRCAGRIPYGYDKVFDKKGTNGLRVVNETKAAIVRRIFEETARGLSAFQVCVNLNREGVPGPRNKGWRVGTLIGGKQLGKGLLRNRIYIGEIEWGRTESRRRKGKIVATPAPASKLSKATDEKLAIVDRELFDEVQRVLAAKNAAPYYRQRKAPYVFTGKYRCGVCGESMIVMSGRLACTGQKFSRTEHTHTDCTNTVRVPREDAEHAVLQGLPDHLLQPELIDLCVEAYRREAERAAASFGARQEADEAKLAGVMSQIESLWPLINDAATPPFAKQALLGQLNGLEAERQRLEFEVTRRPPPPRANLETEQIVGRLKAMLADFSKLLAGDECDAVVARDTVRSMVDKIIVTPDFTTTQRRGSGKVHLRVEGSLTRLLGLADVPVGRDMKHTSGTHSALDVVTAAYTFTTTFWYHHERRAGVLEALSVLTRVLDQAQAPVTRAQFTAALQKEGMAGSTRNIAERVRHAMDYLSSSGMARSVPYRNYRGWVWNDIPLSDDEWAVRAVHPASVPPLEPVARVREPEIRLAIVGPSSLVAIATKLLV